jgi:hypothetical protein
MGGLFGGGERMQAPTPPPPPTRSDADVQAAALKVRLRRAAALGRSETIMTSGQGVTDEVHTPTTVLLGEA